MERPVFLITGATGSVGGATALALARAGASVVLAGRAGPRLDEARRRVSAASGSPAVATLDLDLAAQAAVRAAAAAFREQYGRLDGLIHTAALFSRERRLSPDGLELMFATNHLGPFLLTNLLLDRLTAGAPSRVVVVTAPATNRLDFADLQGERRFSALDAFGASKVCNLLFSYALAERLAGSGVTVSAAHPGLVRSELMREAAWPIRLLTRLISAPPERAGAEIAALASSPAFAGKTGGFYRGGRPIRSSPYTYDRAVQGQLWAASEGLCARSG